MFDTAASALRTYVIEHLDELAQFCGVDIFLLGPKLNAADAEAAAGGDAGLDQRWRVAIYGDMESAEHAKTRVLIFIDRLVSSVGAWDMAFVKLTYSSSVAWSMP